MQKIKQINKMSNFSLKTIKVFVTVVAIGIMVMAKKLGVSIIAANMIGMGIIYAVWKYQPPKNDNNQPFDKK
jgi:hypothetical protein